MLDGLATGRSELTLVNSYTLALAVLLLPAAELADLARRPARIPCRRLLAALKLRGRAQAS